MNDLWFEEELTASDEAVEHAQRSFKSDAADVDAATLGGVVRAKLRHIKPRWAPLDASKSQLLLSNPHSRFILIRLGFEFELSEDGRKSGSHFSFARCSAFLWPAGANEPQPTVYDVIPRDLYEGEPQKVQLKFAPKISLAKADIELGEASTEITIGYVEPVIVGWAGDGDREPHWELRPQTKSLLGARYLWVIVDVPRGCSGVKVAAQSEAEVATPRFGSLLLLPPKRDWIDRPQELLGILTSS